MHDAGDLWAVSWFQEWPESPTRTVGESWGRAATSLRQRGWGVAALGEGCSEVLAVRDPELLHSVVEMGLDGPDREDETVGYVGVGESSGGEVDELALRATSVTSPRPHRGPPIAGSAPPCPRACSSRQRVAARRAESSYPAPVRRARGIGGDLGRVAQRPDRLHLIDDGDQGVTVVGDAGVGVSGVGSGERRVTALGRSASRFTRHPPSRRSRAQRLVGQACRVDRPLAEPSRGHPQGTTAGREADRPPRARTAQASARAK